MITRGQLDGGQADLESLTNHRTWFLSNSSIALFLDKATNIRHPNPGASEHSKGTLFEFLLALAHAAGDERARHVVAVYQAWVRTNVPFESVSQLQSFPISLHWSESDPREWRLEIPQPFAFARTTTVVRGGKSNQGAEELGTFIPKQIATILAGRERSKVAETALEKERERCRHMH